MKIDFTYTDDSIRTLYALAYIFCIIAFIIGLVAKLTGFLV